MRANKNRGRGVGVGVTNLVIPCAVKPCVHKLYVCRFCTFNPKPASSTEPRHVQLVYMGVFCTRHNSPIEIKAEASHCNPLSLLLLQIPHYK